MIERFRKSWRGSVHSSAGYSVRILGRTGIEYRDELGMLRIDSETMVGPGTSVVVYVDSIPERPQRSRREVVERLERAFRYADWQLELYPA